MADKEVRLIDANKLKQVLEVLCKDERVNISAVTYFTIVELIDNMPTIEAEPVKHGRWEINCDGYYPYCSNCKNEPQGREMTLCCPNCGARMDLK